MMPQLLKHTTVKIRPVIGFGLSIDRTNTAGFEYMRMSVILPLFIIEITWIITPELTETKTESDE